MNPLRTWTHKHTRQISHLAEVCPLPAVSHSLSILREYATRETGHTEDSTYEFQSLLAVVLQLLSVNISNSLPPLLTDTEWHVAVLLHLASAVDTQALNPLVHLFSPMPTPPTVQQGMYHSSGFRQVLAVTGYVSGRFSL